jgi:PDZ domain-containing protein
VNIRTRRRWWIGAATTTGVAMLVVGALLPVPFVELAPGPTFNVIGDVDGKPLIEISGTPTYPVDGNLDMTTVNERGGPGNGVYLGRVLVGWADPHIRIVPREAIYPEDQSVADLEAENVRSFSDSESDSTAAALRYLDRPYLTLVVVASVVDGTPADGKLEPGDQILKVNGKTITTPADVTAVMGTVTPGQTVVVQVKRNGKDILDESIVTTKNPKDPTRAFMGISIGEDYKAPFPLAFNLGGVGGPSAGMMLSIGIIDKLTPGNLNGGKHIAGTGTITPDGQVGPIGGIEQKMTGARRAGATLFLAPDTNCKDVLRDGIPDGLTVAKVSTLAEAVTAVEAYVAGKPVTPCS